MRWVWVVLLAVGLAGVASGMATLTRFNILLFDVASGQPLASTPTRVVVPQWGSEGFLYIGLNDNQARYGRLFRRLYDMKLGSDGHVYMLYGFPQLDPALSSTSSIPAALVRINKLTGNYARGSYNIRRGLTHGLDAGTLTVATRVNSGEGAINLYRFSETTLEPVTAVRTIAQSTAVPYALDVAGGSVALQDEVPPTYPGRQIDIANVKTPFNITYGFRKSAAGLYYGIAGTTVYAGTPTPGDFVETYTWGGLGTGNGQFGASAYYYWSTPADLCLDMDDRVYVADSENTRLQVFTADGTFVQAVSLNGFRPVLMDYRDGVLAVVVLGNYAPPPPPPSTGAEKGLSAVYVPATNRVHLVTEDDGVIRAHVYEVATDTLGAAQDLAIGTEPDVVLRQDQRGLLALWRDVDGAPATGRSDDGGRTWS